MTRSMTHHQGKRHPREGGQGAVESILALPAFLLLSCVVLQVALLGVNQLLLQYAAFSAARTGVVRQGDPTPMKAAARQILQSAPGVGRFSPPDLSLEVLPCPAGSASRLLRVRLSWNCPLIVPLAGPLLGGWKGGGSWYRPVFPLRSSWGIPGDPR